LNAFCIAKSYLLKIEQRTTSHYTEVLQIERERCTFLRHSEALLSYFEAERANLAVFPQKNGA
jgi:hypothetical protein